MVNSLVQKGKQFLNIIKPKTRLGLMSGIFVAGICFFFLFVVGDIARGEDGSIGDSILMAIGDLFLWVASKFMGLTIFILKFVIEIASYNGYINSNAVGLGWILVRDITNMFFVIILMLIAFGTVLGIEQYEWKKLLVKFVLAAILVNFSRVICGVIIDAAQVFMMTFISGVAATAGGNIINALQLNDIVSFSKNVSPTEMSSGNMVASAMMAMIFAFGTMLVMGGYLIVLLSRVIALWILIILSPLAFILGIIPKFQSYSSQWWSEFSNNVIIGPVLAFFLWLAFAVAGGGMAHSEFADSSYPMGDNYQAEMETVSREGDEGGSNLNKFLESEQLASFLIAFFMLMAGVKVATKLGAAGSEIMGQAGAFAMKGAAMMSGAAAVKWGARTAGRAAVSGAKKAGKFAAMKAPIVGGEAWKRRGEAIGARASLLGQKIQTWRDVTAKGLEKKGYFGGLAGKALESGARKQKRVDFLKNAVESQKKIREDTWGAGVTPEGKLAGRMMKKAEIVHDIAEKEKRNALAGVKADLLEGEGRHDEAEAIRANDAAADLKELADKTAGLNESQLKTLAANIANERDKMLSDIGDLVAQGKKKEATKLTERMNSKGGINDRARGLMLSAMQKGHSTFKAVEGALASNYSGTTGSEDSGVRFLAAMTGIDAKKNADEANASFEGSMSEAGRNAYLKNVSSLGLAMRKDGDASPALIVSNGREVDSSGRQRLVYGIGANVGSLDSNGQARAEGARDVTGIDEKTLGYIAPKIEFRDAADAEVLLSRDKDGKVGWDKSNIKSFRDRVKGVKTSGQVISVASLSLREGVNTEDDITPEMARELLTDLANDMKDNEIGFKEFMRNYEGLRNKAGIGGKEEDWKNFHRQVVTDAPPPPPPAPSGPKKKTPEQIARQAQRETTWKAEDEARKQARQQEQQGEYTKANYAADQAEKLADSYKREDYGPIKRNYDDNNKAQDGILREIDRIAKEKIKQKEISNDSNVPADARNAAVAMIKRLDKTMELLEDESSKNMMEGDVLAGKLQRSKEVFDKVEARAKELRKAAKQLEDALKK